MLDAFRGLIGRLRWRRVYRQRERALHKIHWAAPVYTNSLGNRERGMTEFLITQDSRDALIGPVHVVLPKAWLFRAGDDVAWSIEADGCFWGWQRAYDDEYVTVGTLVCGRTPAGAAYLRMLARTGVLRELRIGPGWIGEKTPVKDIAEYETGIVRAPKKEAAAAVPARFGEWSTPAEVDALAEELKAQLEHGLKK